MPRRRSPQPSRWTRTRMLRTGAAAVLVIAAAISVMMLTLFVGMRRNDAAIAANPGTATATVLTVGLVRTGIEFVTADGLTVRPPGGVLYPGLLAPGQKFLVEYSTADPELVRVAGRTAAVGNVMIAVVVLVTWLIGSALVLLFGRWSGRPLWRGRPDAAAVTMPEVGPVALDDLPGDEPDGLPGDEPDGLPDGLPDDEPDGLPDDEPDGLPDYEPDGLPGAQPHDVVVARPATPPANAGHPVPSGAD